MLYEINTGMDITMHDGELQMLIPVADGPRLSRHPLTDVSKWGEHRADLGRPCVLAWRGMPRVAWTLREGAGSTPKPMAE